MMDELLVRGLIIGVVFTVLGLVAHYTWKLMRSPSEGARRLRLVVYSLIGLGFLAMIVSAFGVASALIMAGAIAVFIWVKRGFKS